MKFPVKDTLTEKEIQSGLKSVMKDGVASQAMGTLTGGIILVDFALYLGASNLLIGLIAAIPFLAQFIQVPSIYLVEKVRKRRKITVLGAASSRTFLLLIALIPFLLVSESPITFLVTAIFFYASFAAFAACSWNSWMRDLVPQN